MRYFYSIVIFVMTWTICRAQQIRVPLLKTDTIAVKELNNPKYDTLLVLFDSMGREVDCTLISQIQEFNKDSWYRYTTTYDSLGRESGGMVFSLNAKYFQSPYFIKDSIVGIVDTTIFSVYQNKDTTWSNTQYKWYGSYFDDKIQRSYEIKDANGKLIEKAELNDIGGFKLLKKYGRDTVQNIKIIETSHYKKSGMVRYTETDSIFCGQDTISDYVLNSTSLKRTKYTSKWACLNCRTDYIRDSLGQVVKVIKTNSSRDTLLTYYYTYDHNKKIIYEKKQNKYGTIREAYWRYNKQGHVLEYKYLENGRIERHQVHLRELLE